MRNVPEAEKLIGRRNYKQWKQMVELKLSANDLMECIENKNGDPSWTEKQRCKFNAKTQLFINNSVSKNVQSTILLAVLPFAAMASLTKQFGENKTQNALDLIHRLF